MIRPGISALAESTRVVVSAVASMEPHPDSVSKTAPSIKGNAVMSNPDHRQRLDYAKNALEHMAEKADDINQKRLKDAAYALGAAEERLSALEAVVKALAKKAELKRPAIGYPTGRDLPERRLADLLG